MAGYITGSNPHQSFYVSQKRETRHKKRKKPKIMDGVSKRQESDVYRSDVKFSDIGGNDSTLKVCLEY